MKKLLLSLLLFTSFNLTAQTNNYSLDFDGNGDYISCLNNLDGTYSQFTVEGWINISSYPNIDFGKIFDLGGNAGRIILSSSYLNGFEFVISADNTANDCMAQITGVNTVNTWMHIAAVWDGLSSIKLYLNGNIAASNTISPTIAMVVIDTASPLEIGRRYSGVDYFDGKISNISAWNIALDSTQIQQYMNCPPTGNEVGLVGYWNFEEGSGTATADQTSNSNDGTLNGGVTWSSDVPTYECCTASPITSQPTDQTVNIGNNATIDFTDSLTAATYQWQMDAGTGYSDLSNAGQFSGTDTDSLIISTTTMGNNNTNYRCIVTESASCQDTTDASALIVIDNTSIGELDNSLVQLFPNPSNGDITFTLAQHSNGQIILADILGKEVLSKRFTTNEVQINLKSLAAKGTYFAKIIDVDGNVIAIKKLIYQ